MGSKPLSPEALGLVAGMFRILGEPFRLRLLQELRQGERSVTELTLAVEGTQPNVSKHLKVLGDAGLVVRRQEGSAVFYAPAGALAIELCDLVCSRLADRFDAQAKALGGSAARGRRR